MMQLDFSVLHNKWKFISIIRYDSGNLISNICITSRCVTMNSFLETNNHMIYSLGPPKIQRCCSNADDPDYNKPVLIRTFKVVDSQSIWKVCSDCKNDPLYDGTDGVKKSTLLRESISKN